MRLLNWLTKSGLFVCLTLATSFQPCLAVETEANPEYYENDLTLWREPLTNQEFVWLQGGCFQMGQSSQERQQLKEEAGELKYREFYADETPQHKVCLDGFWLARQEITQLQWTSLMATKPFSPNMAIDHPATNISWLMTMDFITVLNGIDSESFRLPTEAEMEYGTRAGTSTPFHTGKTITTDQANYNGVYTYDTGERGAYLEKTAPTRSYPANQVGLFDMHGNVWEWCSDWYDKEYYQHSQIDNPKGPKTGKKKVMRGGSWFTAPRSIRSANRRGIEPDIALEDSGFRLVVNRPSPKKKGTIFNPDF
jgi:formylglycine-generating enzyme required for sulfatase activity